MIPQFKCPFCGGSQGSYTNNIRPDFRRNVFNFFIINGDIVVAGSKGSNGRQSQGNHQALFPEHFSHFGMGRVVYELLPGTQEKKIISGFICRHPLDLNVQN